MNKLNKKPVYKKITLNAEKKYWDKAREFLEKFLEDLDLEIKNTELNKFMVACEEIYSNISNYAYINKKGKVTLKCSYGYNPGLKSKQHGIIFVEFSDSGVKFDPTKKENPAINKEAKDRPVGGLGILMAKKICDSMKYKYINGKNTLVISKNI